DQKLQVRWGIEHYKKMFGHKPEGFWLPEAAVDNQSLGVLAESGLKYTILSGYSASRVREKSGWRTVGHSEPGHLPVVQHSVPCRVKLANGEFFNVFLFDNYLSPLVSYGKILEEPNAAWLADEISWRFGYHKGVLSAFDGEAMGHHKKKGVAVMFDYLDNRAREHGHWLTNGGRLLARAQSAHQRIPRIEIHAPSSWSCHHGVGHWSADCGCYWGNPWRSPLRVALNELADKADRLFEQMTRQLLKNPDEARIQYIHVLLGQQSFREFIADQQKSTVRLSRENRRALSELFDLQVPRQAMFTSCAWFFHGMGYETHLALVHAGELAHRLVAFNPKVEGEFHDRLRQISNTPGAAERCQFDNAFQVMNGRA
ncbi:MAG TPA: DUF3536 domain-containing protein, partial [Candidatus Sulfotelmatobacter sp.]|nr:DUF3536 domain-containing protein [Candidatus Sulfotelmatobacter sp.]